MKSLTELSPCGWCRAESVKGLSMKKLGLVLIAAMWSLAAQAKVAMTGMDFSSLPGGKVEIRMDFNGAPPEPKGYTIEKPARIALDLNDVVSQVSQKKHTLDLGNAQSIVVLEAAGRTRVIVNLVQLTQYSTRVENNSLYLTVGNDGVRDYLKETKLELESKAASNVSSISNVDFRRGEAGEGKVFIELSNPKI